MPIDLSGPLKRIIDENLNKARKAEDSGKKTDAIALYRQIASLYRQWAIETDVAETKKTRLQYAETYDGYAERLASGKPAKVQQPLGAQMEKGDEDEEGLEKQLEHLILRSPVTWKDIGGLESTKKELKLAFALSAVSMPEGVRLEGWKAILLYGPPGTGKTMMAAATSNGLQAVFFNVPLSSILSKYFGESSKLTSTLYNLARKKAPSVLYMDEFEALAAQRTGEESGAERRVLSTILAELDGIASKGDARYILTIAASNVPWLLDKAILSRFQRKVFIPLPDPPARESVLEIQLKKRFSNSKSSFSEVPLKEIVSQTEWFSGRELEGLVRSAVNHMVLDMNSGITDLADQGVESLKKYTLKIRPLQKKDWQAGLDEIKPVTTSGSYEPFLRFEKELST